MDNNYQGQGQFGQNQQVPNNYVPNQQMPNQYGQNPYGQGQPMPNQYGQGQQMPNQYGQNQYGQGVNPNLYNMGNQPYGQNMYGYNNQIPPMDPVAHAEQVRKAKTKKKVFMGFIIGAIALAVIGFIVGIVVVIGLIFKSYDIDEYDNVVEACEEVLGVELEEEGDDYYTSQLASKGYEAVEYASGFGEKNNVKSEVLWIEFTDSGEASLCYDDLLNELEEQHDDISDEFSSCSYSTGVNKAEFNYSEDDEQTSFVLLKSGRCIMLIQVYGAEDSVEDKVDDLLDELD